MGDARTTYQLTASARERYAKVVFDLKRVKRAIEDRAAEGYRELRLVQDLPFDLSQSTPARELENWLDTNQFRYVWSPTPAVLDPLHSALSEDYPEMAIFW